MNMEMFKKKDFIINCGFYGIILAMVYLVFKYIWPIVIPFVLAFVMASLLQKPIEYLHKLLRINKKVVSVLTLILFYAIFGVLIFLICVQGYSIIISWTSAIPMFYSETIEPSIDVIYQELVSSDLLENPDVQNALKEFYSTLFEALKTVLGTVSNLAVQIITGLIKGVPGLFVSAVITVISSFYLTIDYSKIMNYFASAIGEKAMKFVDDTKDFLKNKLLIIVRSYIVIMSLTFLELSIGLTLFGVDNALLIAIGISIFDILPVFGTGGIMIPWFLISFILGDVGMGIRLMLLYITITVVRNIVEPKFVGTHLGIHPVATLATMLIGVNLFGGIGLFGLPILLSFVLFEREKRTTLKK